MKKKIFGGIAVLAIAAVAVLNVNFSANNDNSSVCFLANVEALASFEFNGQNWDNNKHWYNTPGGSWAPYIHDCDYSSSTGGSVSIAGTGVG